MMPDRRPLLETLEERILYSADPGPVGLAAAVVDASQGLQDPTPMETQGTELVFLDSRSPDRQMLLDDFATQQAAGRQLEVVMVDASEDGIGLIGRSLEGRNDVSVIHIVGHGEAGSAQLGASRLDSQTLLLRAGEIAAWSDALTADADLLLYGCDVGAGAAGQDLINGLAELTGADVAASDDPTGSTQLGGDWQLEVQHGQIEAPSLTSDALQSRWLGLLNTYTVTTTADSGAGSFRQAILDANANSGADSINFAISGSQVHTITLASDLPDLTDTVSIDATTDDSFAANGGRPAVVIDVNGRTTGLTLTATADGSSIRGLIINQAAYAAIHIEPGSDGNTIAGNYLGDLDANGNQIAGITNSYTVMIEGANNLIGGTTAADRNVISSGVAHEYSLVIKGSSGNGNIVSGNYFGTDASGTIAFSNSTTSISILSGASGNMIGGPGAGAGNVIGAADGLPVYLLSAGSGNVIQGNRIGVSSSGTPWSGAYHGILVSSGAASILDNWIAGRQIAIWLDSSSGSVVQGNRIGTDLSGAANWGSSAYSILINGNNNLIGGAGAGQGNIIANSNQDGGTYDGIGVFSGTGNVLLGNSIYGTQTATGALGIDLAANGITSNDLGDGDTGANNLQNFPVLSIARTNGSGQVTVSGSLNSTASGYFRIEFFASPSAGTGGYGEGQIYLGFLNVATATSGNTTFSTTFSAAIPSGYVLSATATRSNSTYDAFTDTSEFARSIVIIPSDQGKVVVDTAADILDGDTTSLSTLLANKGADGKVSLREAIMATNNTANGSQPDSITFGIAGTGAHTITLASLLPSIAEAVSIDATTDDSFGANGGRPAVVIDVNGNTNGLTLTATADGSSIRGLVINNHSNAAIQIDAGSDGNTLAGNYLGALDASGNQVTVINSTYTLYVAGANNLIGGSTAADRNVISPVANQNYGIVIFGAMGNGNTVSGNYFGTDASGTTVFSNSANLVSVQSGASGNRIGGPGVGEGNVIGTANGLPVFLYLPGSGNLIQGNRIGVSPSGTLWSGPSNGIVIESGAATILDNWIAGRQSAIWLRSSSGSVVQGNRIGTDLSGSANWGPVFYGVLIEGSNNLVGGTGAGQGNIIANSNQTGGAYDGIGVLSGTGNVLLGNSIYGTKTAAGALGIDLADEGVTPNDLGDGDAGANNLQNFPILGSVRSNGSSQVTVSGSLNSTASSAFRIEFFAGPSAGGSGYGEGRTYLGFVNVTTDAAGSATFSTALAASVPLGYVVTATATGANAGFSTFSNTSEFSAAVVVQGENTAPVLTQGATTGMGGAYPEDSPTLGFPVNGVVVNVGWVDPDPGAVRGMALIGTSGNGIWQYSTDLAVWHDVGTVSGSNALLLSDTSWLRYVGDGANQETPTIVFRAWDMTDGTASTNGTPSYATPGVGGGTSAFSAQTANAFTVISGVNDAPVLTPGSPVLGSITEDETSNGGQTIASILGSSVSDVDNGALEGIAVVGTANGNGFWAYSTNGGTSWNAVGTVSDGSAFLLRAEDKVRFVPDGKNGTAASITYRAWDQSSGAPGSKEDASTNGGTSAFSTATDTASLIVTDVNDVPLITSGATASVPENGATVLTVTATDADLPAQTLTYSIIGGADASKFQIDANTGTLSFITAPDFEVPTDVGGNNIYDVTVQVSDGAGGTASQAITVTVTPINDNVPLITSSAAASVPENTTAVLTVTATDADLPAQTLTYSIIGGADASKFQIDANTGALSFIAAPDFEVPTDVGGNNIYDVTVQVSDGAGGTASQAITVTVTPGNDSVPVITSSAIVSVPENTTAVLTVTATDADQPPQTLTYSIIGGADAAKFQIDANTGALSFIAAPDFEGPTDAGGNNFYDVIVQVSDGAGGTASQAISVSVTNVNENGSAPVITSNSTASIPENTSAVLTVTATDADLPAQTLTYSIIGGADAAKFQIDANTGALSFITAPDFEVPTDVGGNNIYDVTVQVSDGVGGTASQAISVSVTNVNENGSAPVITSNSTASIPENTSAVLTVTATDADLPAQTLTYSIIGGADASKFQIDAKTGALSFIAAPDFEVPTDVGGNNIYDVTVQVSDGVGGTTSQAISVVVRPINDNTPVITSSATASVSENSTLVLIVTAKDGDLPTQPLTYSIIGGVDASKFQVDASTGALSFITAPDFEVPTDVGGDNIYHLTVQVSDGAGGTVTQGLLITVVDVKENLPLVDGPSNGNTPGSNGSGPPAVGEGALPQLPQPAPQPPQGDKVPPQAKPRPEVLPEDVLSARPAESTGAKEGGGSPVQPTEMSARRQFETRTALYVERAQVVLTVGGAPSEALMEFLLSGEMSDPHGAEGRAAHAVIVAGRTPPALDGGGGEEAQRPLALVGVASLVLSAGTIWWAVRASGLIASLLMTAPVWITFDPLPVLGPQDEEEPDWSTEEGTGEAPGEENVDEMFVNVDDRGVWQ